MAGDDKVRSEEVKRRLEECRAWKTAASHRITKPINGTYSHEISFDLQLVLCSVTQTQADTLFQRLLADL